jgi:hypothetical protein
MQLWSSVYSYLLSLYPLIYMSQSTPISAQSSTNSLLNLSTPRNCPPKLLSRFLRKNMPLFDPFNRQSLAQALTLSLPSPIKSHSESTVIFIFRLLKTFIKHTFWHKVSESLISFLTDLLAVNEISPIIIGEIKKTKEYWRRLHPNTLSKYMDIFGFQMSSDS